MPISIGPLRKDQDRSRFSCGNLELDDWFRRRASQDERRNVTRVFVATDADAGIVGFYSLSSFTLRIDDLPEDISRKLPRYGLVPAALIGRLARDVSMRSRGIGELLLADAIRRILDVGRSVAVFAIVVDAKDEHAASFYLGFGFRHFPNERQRLFLLTSTAAEALERSV